MWFLTTVCPERFGKPFTFEPASLKRQNAPSAPLQHDNCHLNFPIYSVWKKAHFVVSSVFSFMDLCVCVCVCFFKCDMFSSKYIPERWVPMSDLNSALKCRHFSVNSWGGKSVGFADATGWWCAASCMFSERAKWVIFSIRLRLALCVHARSHTSWQSSWNTKPSKEQCTGAQ